MSTPLVPIAISSEIDVAGNERIHAANYTGAITRLVFVLPPPLVMSGTLADGIVGTPYSSSLTVSSGLPGYSGHTIVAGSLPPGLSLITSTGPDVTFAGTPT